MRRTIELEFSETDRQIAERYENSTDCIVATALKNRGLNVKLVTMGHVELEDGEYSSDDANCQYVCWDFWAPEKPFYHPEVVGKKLVLVSERDDYEDAETTQELAEAVG